MYDLLIIGGGPAGLTAALYLARAGCRTLVLERRGYGGQIAITNEVVNYPGVPKTSGIELTDTMRRQAEDFGAEFLIAEARELSLFDAEKTVKTSAGDFRCLGVLLATGAQPKMAGFRGEEDFRGRGVSYCATCDGAFFKDKNVAVVGGGNTALDDALVLSFTSKKVYLIHRSDTFSGEKRLLEKLQEHDNVVFILDSEVTAINGSERLESLGIRNKVSGEEQTLDVDAVFIAIGHVPDNKAFASLVELDAYGYIKTDENCATSCPGIYAAGDGRVKKVRQLTTAAADGTEAALAACDYIDLL